MNDREVINDAGLHNKSFKFVPALRASTGRVLSRRFNKNFQINAVFGPFLRLNDLANVLHRPVETAANSRTWRRGNTLETESLLML